MKWIKKSLSYVLIKLDFERLSFYCHREKGYIISYHSILEYMRGDIDLNEEYHILRSDGICYRKNKNIELEKLIRIYNRLPHEMKKLALMWGVSDTQFREEFCSFVRNEKKEKFKKRLEKINKIKDII